MGFVLADRRTDVTKLIVDFATMRTRLKVGLWGHDDGFVCATVLTFGPSDAFSRGVRVV